MTPSSSWPTVAAVAAAATAINVGFHEAVHAVTCAVVGGDLAVYSALGVLCESVTAAQDKVVAGSAPVANLVFGTVVWWLTARWEGGSPPVRYFWWLLMLMNWLYGAGYLLFSGIGGVGDMAVVIQGWEPAGLIRLVMAVVGAALFMAVVFLALRRFGRFIGGDPGGEQIRRARRLGWVSYGAAIVTTGVAAFMSPGGVTGLPAVAGMIAAVGALSPLVWMMEWFQADIFPKDAGTAFVIERRGRVIAGGLVAILVYGVVLGRGLTF